MKNCPNCQAELRNSVIRCVRCGQSVRGLPEVEAAVSGSRTQPAQLRRAEVAPAWRVGAIEAGAAFESGPSGSVGLGRRAPSPPLPNLAVRRALPVARSFGPDPFMLLAGAAALGAGILAYGAIKASWVHLTITRTATDSEPAFVTGLSVKGQVAFVGSFGAWLAIGLGVLGLLWLVFGSQRGWAIPWYANPMIGLLATLMGLLATLLSSTVWFVWEEAMVQRARAARLSSEAMRELLDLQPPPLVQIQRLSGLMTFGGMMLLGVVASCLAFYASRRRGE